MIAFRSMNSQENSEHDNGQINEPMFTYKHFWTVALWAR
jgi:hypothetical protein